MNERRPKLIDINPRKLLKRAIDGMKDYRMPDCKDVGIESGDTGAIVSIILYFMAREQSIGRTKLECYLILIDRLSYEETRQHLFRWRLTGSGHIRNFKKVLDFMQAKQLISRRGNHEFNLLKGILKIRDFPAMLDGVLRWLRPVLNEFRYVTARDLTSQVWGSRARSVPDVVQLPLFPDEDMEHADVLRKVNDIIDAHQAEYVRQYPEGEGEYEANEGMLEKLRTALMRHDVDGKDR